MDVGFLLAGRYRLKQCLGIGGMAEVWRAKDEVLTRQVAVKLLDAAFLDGPSARRRFREEAQAGARLSHHNIVTIHDYGETEDDDGAPLPYIVMELLEGENLADRIGAGALPVAEAVRVCGQLAEALAEAHRSGVVHRDVKPSNVFLTATGVKVLDFGIAQMISPGSGDADTGPPVSTEPLLGTAPYLAPEAGTRATDAAVDVYALGVVLTEALTRRRAPHAALPDSLPTEVAMLCTRCRASDPAVRPSAAEVARILRDTGTSLRDTGALARDSALAVGTESGSDGVASAEPATTTPPTRELPADAAVAEDSRNDPEDSRNDAALSGSAATLDRAAVPAGDGAAVPDDDGAAYPVPEPVEQPPAPGKSRRRRIPLAAAAVAALAALAAGIFLGPARTPDRDGAPAPPSAAPAPPAASPSARVNAEAANTALARMRPAVERGLAAGEIRSDVAVDLQNVIGNLQTDLGAESPVELDRRIAELREKIVTRLREGGLSRTQADKLTAILAGAAPR